MSTSIVPKNCCGRTDGAGCVCAAEAKCSCGKNAAMHCNCEKSSTENVVPTEACSCGLRAKGSCTCSRSDKKEANAGDAEGNEVDFTTQ
ncbi:hypothetical protein EJ08DRAFT_638055 [Tothia fuscella]|uniref:DUF7871 domain-containing protein n=1 Tax=Tothia fuscella TaxID=1048955 RepID=A0A9P4NLH0_9PEZI|nr:hypothetical protein EJ08DRAFT_638055 [Tothia fuscella]